MLVQFEDLKNYQGKVAMVDGGFDPLHHGHIKYFESASTLGVPVLCNVTGDNYVARKHAPLLSLDKRCQVIDALKYISFTHPNAFDTETVLEELKPKFYVKGSDWKGRLPPQQVEICQNNGTEIVYLETILDSSTKIFDEYVSKTMSAQVAAFEQFALTQTQTGEADYDDTYFTHEWRDGGNAYTVEARRKIEGRNPELIRDTFRPKKVLDMGCGPGALMYLLQELDVQADGVDFSPDCIEIAPLEVGERIKIGSVTDVDLPSESYDLVICREVFEHLTVLQIQKAVQNIARITSKYVYVTTRFHKDPWSLFDVGTEFDVDPTHITCMNKDFLRLMFVLQGMRRRADLEQQMDWLGKHRVLVYEKVR